MSPIMFKDVMFLKVDREFWDESDTATAVKVHTPSEVQEKDSNFLQLSVNWCFFNVFLSLHSG